MTVKHPGVGYLVKQVFQNDRNDCKTPWGKLFGETSFQNDCNDCKIPWGRLFGEISFFQNDCKTPWGPLFGEKILSK